MNHGEEIGGDTLSLERVTSARNVTVTAPTSSVMKIYRNSWSNSGTIYRDLFTKITATLVYSTWNFWLNYLG